VDAFLICDSSSSILPSVRSIFSFISLISLDAFLSNSLYSSHNSLRSWICCFNSEITLFCPSMVSLKSITMSAAWESRSSSISISWSTDTTVTPSIMGWSFACSARDSLSWLISLCLRIWPSSHSLLWIIPMTCRHVGLCSLR